MAAHGTSFKPQAPGRKVNIDLIAVSIALALAALIRLNILPHINF